MPAAINTIRAFVETAREINNDPDIYVSGYHLARELGAKVCRGGRIPKDARSIEGYLLDVAAYYVDDLGNVVAVCYDGKIRQFH